MTEELKAILTELTHNYNVAMACGETDVAVGIMDCIELIKTKFNESELGYNPYQE